jgi:hypothetical protein
MELMWLTTPMAVIGAAIASAVVYGLWLAGPSDSQGPSVAGFLLDLLSMPVGIFALVVAVFAGLDMNVSIILPVVLGLAGAVLIGRSLRELPWVGVAALGLGVGAAIVVDRTYPNLASDAVLLAVGALVFLLSYAILALVTAPFRLVGWIGSNRAVSVILGLAALGVGVLEAFLAGFL